MKLDSELVGQAGSLPPIVNQPPRDEAKAARVRLTIGRRLPACPTWLCSFHIRGPRLVWFQRQREPGAVSGVIELVEGSIGFRNRKEQIARHRLRGGNFRKGLLHQAVDWLGKAGAN